MRACAVTGMGAVSCLGIGMAEHFEALSAGRSGVTSPSSFDHTGFKPTHVGEVNRERLRAYAERLIVPFSTIKHRKELLAAVAISEAWRDAFGNGQMGPACDPARIAIVLGTGLTFGPEPVDWILSDTPAHAVRRPAAGREDLPIIVEGDGALRCLAKVSGARGIQIELNSACAASGHALGLGSLMIRRGYADMVVVGGVDAMITPIGVAGFQLLGATSARSGKSSAACKPFDRRRDGTIIGEGAAILILEATDRTEKKTRPFWGYVEGTGFSADGFSVTAPHPNGAGARRAMLAALRSASREPHEVQYLNAHGTGTRLNDVAETDAIKNVFGERVNQLWISATKPMTGHLVAAAGALEAIITLMTINTGVVFPTINLERPDPLCDLDYVPLTARRREVNCAMSNSFGLGGQNSCVVLGAPQIRRQIRRTRF